MSEGNPSIFVPLKLNDLMVCLLVFRFRKTLLGARPKPHGKVACKPAVYECVVYIVNWQWVVYIVKWQLAVYIVNWQLAVYWSFILYKRPYLVLDLNFMERLHVNCQFTGVNWQFTSV